MTLRSSGRRSTRSVCAGELEPHWSCWFAGLRVETGLPGETLIVGPVTDQAALHGLLARIRDLGMPLLSMRVIDEGDG